MVGGDDDYGEAFKTSNSSQSNVKSRSKQAPKCSSQG
jgi:hypothetical protein